MKFAASLVLLCTAAASAQTYATSPGGYLTREGEDYARFGQFPDGRMMYFDGEMRSQPMGMRSISLRRDKTSSFAGAGRSWKTVDLRIATCDIAKVSTTFSLNPTSTPTLAFTGTVSWPTLSAPSGAGPAPWAYEFPFASPWIYTAQADICADFDFTGGTLANNRSWPTNVGLAYFMDSFPTGESADGVQVQYGVGTGTGCYDKGSGSTKPGLMRVSATVHGPNASRTSYRNMYEVFSYSSYTAPSATVVHALGFLGIPNGLAVPGVTCNKLFVDTTKPTLYFFATTGSSTSASSGTIAPTGGNGLFAYLQVLVGIELWFQAGWSDSSTSALKFTNAVRVALPAMPKVRARKMIYHYHPNLKYGVSFNLPDTDGYYNPIFRYTY